MVGRVLLGNRAGVRGLWVSKPGYEVTTCSLADMLFNFNAQSNRVIQAGQFVAGANPGQVYIPFPYVGHIPNVLLYADIGGGAIADFSDYYQLSGTSPNYYFNPMWSVNASYMTYYQSVFTGTDQIYKYVIYTQSL